jgi:hypothetical protein
MLRWPGTTAVITVADHTPSCWIVGDEDGGRAVWEQRDADAGRENGWTVIPMYSENVLAKATVQSAAEALREAAGRIDPGDHHCFKMMCPWCTDRRTKQAIRHSLIERADRIAVGGADHA